MQVESGLYHAPESWAETGDETVVPHSRVAEALTRGGDHADWLGREQRPQQVGSTRPRMNAVVVLFRWSFRPLVAALNAILLGLCAWAMAG